MIEPKDKRTKEYKKWLKTQDKVEIETSVGLGDVMEKITSALGIEKCSKCDERLKKWNKAIRLFRYTKVVNCLTDEQLELYKEYKSVTKINEWSRKEVKFLIDLYFYTFKIPIDTRTFCANCIGSGNTLRGIEDKLDKLIEKQSDDS
jgi:hypothetical protein